MSQELTVVRADPAGNITLFVLDPVPKALRPAVAARLTALPGYDAEQVGFACPPRPGFDGQMEMAGGEFCGNASRAYGMLLARQRGIIGKTSLTLSVSGTEHPVPVDLDTEAGTARASMPLPCSVDRIAADGIEGTLVDLGGIVHFVTRRAPDAAILARLEPRICAPRREGGFAGAYGVIFLHGGRMTPLVKVPAAGTLVWEGSCGSGSLAAAVAESLGGGDGHFVREYVQPAGTVRAELEWRGGAVSAAYIGGSVTLNEPKRVTLPESNQSGTATESDAQF